MKPAPIDASRASGVLFQKLLYVLHRAWVDARTLALAQRHEQVARLADALEIIPSLIANWEETHLALIRHELAAYQEEYGEEARDYVTILDMDDDQFVSIYASW